MPRSRSRASRSSSCSRETGPPSYASLPGSSPNAPVSRANAGVSSSSACRRAAASSVPSAATWSVHGSTASRDDRPFATRRSAAFRWPTTAPYSADNPARAGNSRPSARSKYARRTAGAPFTIPSRSGVKTSVETSARSSSAARNGPPFSFARLPFPGSSVTSSSSGVAARRPRSDTRPIASPNRTSCASFRVRGENPCVPTCSDSSRFVFPAPFGPTTSTRPCDSPSSSVAYERMFRSATVSTIRWWEA